MAESKWPRVKDNLNLIRKWARDGATDAEIMQKLDISKDTFYRYRQMYPDFCEALKHSREVADSEVEAALYKRAIGYSYEEVTEEWIPVKNEKTGELEAKKVVTKRVTKQVAPDVTAQIFWTKNRMPQQWRDKREVAVEGGMTYEIKLPELLTQDEGDGEDEPE